MSNEDTRTETDDRIEENKEPSEMIAPVPEHDGRSFLDVVLPPPEKETNSGKADGSVGRNA